MQKNRPHRGGAWSIAARITNSRGFSINSLADKRFAVSRGTVFPKRGIYRLEPLVAKCQHPFGFVQRQRTLCDREQWMILPAIGQLDVERFRSWVARMARSDGQVIRTSRPSMVRQDDLHGLRPFRPGDSPRWIHWRTSARRNQKMVREFEEASGQNLMLILDPWSLAAKPEALEAAISLAATICWDWSRHGHDQLFFAAATQEPTVISGSSDAGKIVVDAPRSGSGRWRTESRRGAHAQSGFANSGAGCAGRRG